MRKSRVRVGDFVTTLENEWAQVVMIDGDDLTLHSSGGEVFTVKRDTVMNQCEYNAYLKRLAEVLDETG